MTAFFHWVGENFMKLVSMVHWYDILDIVLVALVFYYCIRLFTRTRSIHLVRGFVFLGLFYFIVSALNMSTTSFLFSRLFSDIVLVIVLLFQPEFRRAIESFGRGDFTKFTLFSRYSSLMREETLRRTFMSDPSRRASVASLSETGISMTYTSREKGIS